MQESPDGRRRSRRIKLGKSGAGSVAESMGLLDSDLNEHVQNMANTQKPPPQESTTLKLRLDHISMGSKAYEKEYRLKAIHRLLMRNIPLDKIADELEVSIHTVMRDRKEIGKRLRGEAKNLDIDHMIGDTLAYYKEIQAMSLKEASSKRTPINMRLAALRTALAAKNDQFRFLSTAGVMDVLRYQAAENEGQSDIEKMVEVTEAILKGEDLTEVAKDIIQEEHEIQIL